MEGQKHYVLVHGSCHGAWCWFKLKPLLESAGHRVTAMDLIGSGINSIAIQEIRTHKQYVKPLLDFLESLPENEKVIIVGHSFGGMNIALAMELFPHKISVAVYLSAFMPDTVHQPAFVLQTYDERTPKESWLDTQFTAYGTSEEPATSMFFGHNFLAFKLYQLSSAQDLELAKSLIRPGSLFIEDLTKINKFTNEGYGSVKRVFIICNKDHGIPKEFQRWMIKNSNVSEVMEITDADHMAMLSKPQELCDRLLAIATAL